MDSPQSPTPQRSRGFSVKSDKSDKSGSTSHKRGPSESSEEKSRRNLHTKADPLIAMNELQPMAVALQKSNLGSLRELEFKDQYGNVITDPDLSNPTRPRLERPLDTIRSFEAAIYGTSINNRASYARTEDASQMGDFSRRTSYYGSPNGPSNSYYGQSRPDSIVNAYQNTPLSPEGSVPYNQGYNQNGYSQNGRRRPSHHPRGSPSSPISPSEGYPNIAGSQYGYQRSRDNIAAMSNNSGTTDYGQSTDPSSINSSNDQLQQQALQQQRLDERSQAEYGFNGFNSKAPPVQPIRDPTMGGPVGGVPISTTQSTVSKKGEKADKRKSWFKRRFSKDK
ncbi:hypothetical protein DTO013E5_3523 [Penicillium roqueforti]|uniref:Uncharacterized protein n=1 Tax=Penicillium roqueforti (strain FM164) TaxID=1365484 RepID=W6QRX8_PENRF|nr:uncharacterized protein LCP9604111_6799 [Penicillium roqueforti]CDM32282.1 Protein of unknown function DUF2406 [Penicillium roqueforti FM164]KAF9245481.1 hypothetical protein LCP9604111_6799 [Penicillium roqueforti]KAI1832883.1 hypothetical protein CBS147337_6294 [Penicillium roqueforti]KAI2672031.1 hypothetical protein LCP963914a_9494 [Penicillium roqueforti]KAI2675905.1 hypothetical protein CBS147355_6086 [Penicillium roqueforti]